MLHKQTYSNLETEKFAAKFAKTLKLGSILLLIGELGAGKTTFVRGLARGLKISEVKIHSPTFTLINEYPGKIPLIHVDLYRLNARAEIEELGLEDYFKKEGIMAVEWADRIQNFWPQEAIRVELRSLSKQEREISVSGV